MSVRLILVRPGETKWNKKGKLQGRSEIPINENGKREMRGTGIKIKRSGEKPEKIIASPMARAMQSAWIIANILKVSLRVDKNLAERDLGSLEGLTWKEIEKECANFKKRDRQQKYDYSIYGGENSRKVNRRIANFIDAVKKYDGKTILVVVHPGIAYMLRKKGKHSLRSGYCIVEL